MDALLSADSLPLDRDIVLLFLVAAGTDAACTSAWSPELGELAICTSFVARTAPGDKGIADVKVQFFLHSIIPKITRPITFWS